VAHGDRRREKIKQLTPRRQDAKARKEELPCFLCALKTFAPLREMLFPFGRFFHTFDSRGKEKRSRLISQARQVGTNKRLAILRAEEGVG
jgi:hypothetical protein